jgi:heme a synthase
MGVAQNRISNFRRYALAVLVFTVIVMVWGAVVRATGSGAGCGQHWPSCQGQVIPLNGSLKTMIEFGHRTTSGLSLLLVAGLLGWSRRLFPTASRLCTAARWSMVFILGEAMVGAALVLLRLVGEDDSAARAVVIALHLVNTFLLLYWLTVVWFESSLEVVAQHQLGTDKTSALCDPHATDGIPVSSVGWKWLLIGFASLGATGAIVALGDTLFHHGSLAEGIKADLASGSHFLLKLRIVHPLLAVIVGFASIQWFLKIGRNGTDKQLRRWALVSAALILGQMMLGAVNLLLMAPTWIQVSHLALAYALWVSITVTYQFFRCEGLQLKTKGP